MNEKPCYNQRVAPTVDLHDIVAYLDKPVAASGGTPTWVWAALVTAGFVALTVLTMALARYPVLRRPPALTSRPEPPDAVARRELDALAGLLERGELKEYYRRLAACLRQYLAHRFAVPASALTARVLEERLAQVELDPRAVRLISGLFRQCEAVQSAQEQPAREQAEADLATACEILELTRQGDASPAGRETPREVGQT